MHFYHKVYHFWNEHIVLRYSIIFLVSFFVFLSFQWSTYFPDPDSFYHLKVAELIRDHGVVFHFPWARYTVLSQIYIDQHFLYHVLLIPFVSFIQPFLGLKIATAFFSAAFATVFFLLLNILKVRYPYIWVFFLLTTIPLTFRLSLAKAVSISLFFLFLGIIFAVKKKYWWLFFWSALYVWTYGGFPLLIVLSSILIFFRFLYTKKFFVALELFCSVIFGTLFGIIVNPYFPTNLSFYWQQTVQIGMVNFKDVIGVGGEWYPYGFTELMSGSILLTLFLVVAFIWFVFHIRHNNAISWVTFFWFIFFLLLTLKSRRYVEYYIPFAVLFTSYMWSYIIDRFFLPLYHVLLHTPYRHRHVLYGDATKSLFKHITHSSKHWQLLYKIFGVVFVFYFSLMIPAVIFRDYRANIRDTRSGIPYQKFQSSMTWLKDHGIPGETVLHSDWDEFPILFYYDSDHYYIVGLDPTFMYKYNEQLYWDWVHITTGQLKDDLHKVITEEFDARYVFLENDHKSMRKNIEVSGGFKKIYEDSEATIYEVE